MLKWFADRLARTGEDVRKDERGFTLIELLVVVIIIGILAAIAIPTFLAQRENAEQAQIVSDLRNAATAAQSIATENNGSYETVSPGTLADNGAETSPDNSISDASGTDDSYTITVSREGGDSATFNGGENGGDQIETSWGEDVGGE